MHALTLPEALLLIKLVQIHTHGTAKLTSSVVIVAASCLMY